MDDVGSWLAVGRIKKSNENGNVVNGNIITINSKNNIIEGSQKLIARLERRPDHRRYRGCNPDLQQKQCRRYQKGTRKLKDLQS